MKYEFKLYLRTINMLGDVFNFKTDICMYKNLILEVILITIILIQLFLGHFEDSLIQQIFIC